MISNYASKLMMYACPLNTNYNRTDVAAKKIKIMSHTHTHTHA